MTLQTPNDQHFGHDQQMEEQALFVTFPVNMPEHTQLASANSSSTSGNNLELSLVTCDKGSEECRKTRRRLSYAARDFLDTCLQRNVVGVLQPIPAHVFVNVSLDVFV